MTEDDWLANYGVPCSRASEGTIYQRALGGQSLQYGKDGQVYRSACAVERVGPAVLSLKERVRFFFGWFALDLMMVDWKCVGIIAMRIEDGTCHRIFARNMVEATEGTSSHL
jgi:succinate dehydrogenase (ubiquinone) flavoprotein subunit